MTYDHNSVWKVLWSTNLKKLHKSETRQAAPCAWAINSQHLGMVPCCLCTGQTTTQKYLCTTLSHFAKYNNNWCSCFMMVIIQLVLADWPVSIIETASVLVKRKLYTCTNSYMISIFVFPLDRVNTIINALKCYLCLHDLSYCRVHVPINQMVHLSKISLIHQMGRWNGTVWAWFGLKTLYNVHLQV